MIHTRRPHSTHTHLHDAKLLLWTLTFLCHKTLTTVEFRTPQVSLSPSLFQYPRSHNFCISISAPLLLLWFVLMQNKTKQKQTNPHHTFSFILVCFLWVLASFFVYCGIFFPQTPQALAKYQRYKHTAHLSCNKGPCHQMSTCTVTSDLMCQVLKAKLSYFTVLLFCTIYARSFSSVFFF